MEEEKKREQAYIKAKEYVVKNIEEKGGVCDTSDKKFGDTLLDIIHECSKIVYHLFVTSDEYVKELKKIDYRIDRYIENSRPDSVFNKVFKMLDFPDEMNIKTLVVSEILQYYFNLKETPSLTELIKNKVFDGCVDDLIDNEPNASFIIYLL